MLVPTKTASIKTKIILQLLVWIPLFATVYAIATLWGRMITLTDLVLLLVGYTLCALGITVGYHRMLTHKGFEAPDWIRAIFLILGSMALQGPALNWAATHIQHHANSDDDDDPHSPLKSFFHAHVGWILNDFRPDLQRYAGPLLKDKLVVFISNTFFLWFALSLLIPFLIGGWVQNTAGHFNWSAAGYALLWGGAVRLFLNHHVTWAVNSVCHTYGGREFITTDASRNNLLIGLLAMGEGWHNNHHAFPRSANHGMHWWQIDPSAYVIGTLEKLGLIKNVVRIAPERLAIRRIKADISEERDVLPGLVLPGVVMEHGTAMAAAASTMAEVVSKAAAHQPPL
jgi:stearoyl-CoA desaturase (delta-9 desaturase)